MLHPEADHEEKRAAWHSGIQGLRQTSATSVHDCLSERERVVRQSDGVTSPQMILMGMMTLKRARAISMFD